MESATSRKVTSMENKRQKKREVKVMKRAITSAMARLLSALVVAGTTLAVSTTAWARQNWIMDNNTYVSTRMIVSIQSGWSAVSAWTSRGDVAMSSAMTPVGDGTFEIRADLVPGGQYNYMFWAIGSTNTAPSGFGVGSENSEPVPNSGNDMGTFLSFSSASVSPVSSGTPSLGYGSVNGDGRRLIRMPDVAAGTTIWVFNNFASTPTGVANTNVNLTDNSIELSWKGAQGYWGTGTGSMDIMNGRIRIYVSTGGAGGGLNGPYGLIADLAGTATTFAHSAGVVQGTTYYFVFVPSDTYSGAADPTTFTRFAGLSRDKLGNSGQTVAADNYKNNTGNFNYNDLQGKPAARVPTYFKVQGGELDYILKHDSIVYLTPWEVNDPAYPHKIPATLAVAYVPHKKN